jgi:hypothetical protein
VSRHETSKKLTRERELARKREARAAARPKRKHFGNVQIAGEQTNAPVTDFGELAEGYNRQVRNP